MFWNKYFIPSFLLLVAIAALHLLASYEGYYWTVPWYDWMMHFLGGAWVALFLLWVSLTDLGSMVISVKGAKTIILVGLLVGIAWELYEVSFGITSIADRGYAFDTAHDLLMDVVGASAVAYVYKKTIGKK